MELTIHVDPVGRTVRLREVRALAAGDSCSVVLEGVRGANAAALRLALYRDAASDSPVASCPSFSPVRGHPNLATGDLRLDTAEMAAWFEAVRPEPGGSATDRDGSRSGDAAERAVRTDGWLVVSTPTRTWAACRVPVILRPGAGVSGVVDPTSIQSLVEGLVSAAMSEALAAKADLVDGKVPANQLPSYVDDVLEYDAISSFPDTGETGKIYVAKDTNLTYRWSGTQYVEISKSLALGETAETAYPGNKGKAAAENADKAYTFALQTADTVNSLGSTIRTHIENTNNPHKVTAEQVGAVPLVEDVNSNKTAVTIGIRTGRVGPYSLANGNNVTASGDYSHAEGVGTKADGFDSHAEGSGTTASGLYSHAEGYSTTSSGNYSHAEGSGTTAKGLGSHVDGVKSQTKTNDKYAFAWNGDETRVEPYVSHGQGTFNINPVGGTDGFYVGEQTLASVISGAVSDKADKATTLAGYGITDAATKTELNAKADKSALAAKADKSTTLAGYGITDGATKTELAELTAKVEYPLYAVPSTGVLKDRAINTTSLATVTVPDNFTDLLIRASVASSLSVTMPEAIATKYGDTFPGEAGEYLITITKTGTAEAYVRTIKLEVANA